MTPSQSSLVLCCVALHLHSSVDQVNADHNWQRYVEDRAEHIRHHWLTVSNSISTPITDLIIMATGSGKDTEFGPEKFVFSKTDDDPTSLPRVRDPNFLLFEEQS